MLIKLIKEPLLHFVLIGIGLFAIYSYLNPDSFDSNNEIVISPGQIEHLSARFNKSWNRPPTEQELKGLIDDLILEEVYYRQAIELGIDQNDSTIRRHLRKKMEFLTRNSVSLLTPKDEELIEFMNANSNKFKTARRYSFEHVYFRIDRPGDELESLVSDARKRLLKGQAVEGEPSLLRAIFQMESDFFVDNTFGPGFANKLDALPLNEWSEPVMSGLGVHLVRLTERTESVLPPLEEIRTNVMREWAHNKGLEVTKTVNNELVGRYEINVQWPQESPDAS